MSTSNGSTYRIAPFTVDITPPVGHPIAYGINNKVDSPVYIRGLIVDDGRKPCVLASADVIGASNSSHDTLVRIMAKGAGTSPNRVFLHAVHQHDSIWLGGDADGLLEDAGKQMNVTPEHWADIQARLGKAVRSAASRGWKRVYRVASSEQRVSGLASNRRLLDKNDKVWGMRFSMCTNPAMQREPVGKIDPLLRSICFYGHRNKLLAGLHYYASHPMAAYQRNMISADVPGVALDHLHARCGDGSQHIYFTGCAGDITFGKYVYKKKEKSLSVLGERLGSAMLASLDKAETRTLGKTTIRHQKLNLSLVKPTTKRDAEALFKRQEDRNEYTQGARYLIMYRDWEKQKTPKLSCISLGPDIHIVTFPSEFVVEYQLYAQALVPDQFLAAAGYCTYDHLYFPTAKMYDEGGYEPRTTLVNRKAEGVIKGGLDQLLGPLR